MCLVLGRRDNIRRAVKLVAPARSPGTTDSWQDWIAAARLPPWPDALADYLHARERVDHLASNARLRAADRARLRGSAQWFTTHVGANAAAWTAHARTWAEQSRDEAPPHRAATAGLAGPPAPHAFLETLGGRARRRAIPHEAVSRAPGRRRGVGAASVEPGSRRCRVAALRPAGGTRAPSPGRRRSPRKGAIDLFSAALRLHGSALTSCSGAVGQTMSTWGRAVGSPHEFTVAERVALWRSLFAVVPVVTTTFASAGRMLRDFGPDGLGNVIIDEAGQVPPTTRYRYSPVSGEP